MKIKKSKTARTRKKAFADSLGTTLIFKKLMMLAELRLLTRSEISLGVTGFLTKGKACAPKIRVSILEERFKSVHGTFINHLHIALWIS